MSTENLGLIRQIYEDGLFDCDLARLLEFMSPDVEYVNPPEAVDPGIRRGQAEVRKALIALEAFDSMSTELHELFDAGDRVVAWVTFRTRSGGSEHQVGQSEAHTWTLRTGRITRFEWGRDLSAALRAVGLSK